MHTRIKKIEFILCEKLEQIDSDINQAIRKLFNTLRNEAEKIWADHMIEHNTTLITKNEEELKTMPEREQEYWDNLRNDLYARKRGLEMDFLIYSIRVGKPKILCPHYEYETSLEYESIVINSNDLALKNTKRDLEKVNAMLDKLDDQIKNNNMFTEKAKELQLQIVRCKKEIDRMKQIQKIDKLFEVAQ